MDNQGNPKWYFKTWSLVVSFLCVGPLMLPLVWTNPRFSRTAKAFITVIAIVLTILMSVYLVRSLKNILQYYQMGAL